MQLKMAKQCVENRTLEKRRITGLPRGKVTYGIRCIQNPDRSELLIGVHSFQYFMRLSPYLMRTCKTQFRLHQLRRPDYAFMGRGGGPNLHSSSSPPFSMESVPKGKNFLS